MKEEVGDKLTVYLDGHEGHRGNVLLHSFVRKVHRLALVLGKLERAYLGAAKRQTDFEIIDADKVNPTTLTLQAVPHIRAYNPAPAFKWSLQQIRAVGDGRQPDERVTFDIADDLAELARRDSPDGYRRFWLNGYAEEIAFDDDYLANATKIVADRRRREAPSQWHEGTALGSVVGELRKLDDFEHDREFVIVPAVGDPVFCKFPPSMDDEMGGYWRKIVKVSGVLHYKASSPFPESVDVSDGGIELYATTRPRRTLREMRGVFAGRERAAINWGDLLDG